MASRALQGLGVFRWRVLALLMMVATTEATSQAIRTRYVRTVPNVTGLTVDSATKLLLRADLTASPRDSLVSDRRVDIVLRQSPEGGTPIQESTVELVVARRAKRPAPVPPPDDYDDVQPSQPTVPNVVGLPANVAKILLALRAHLVANEYDSAVTHHRSGIVFDQNPRAGSRIPGDGVVHIFVARPPVVIVPPPPPPPPSPPPPPPPPPPQPAPPPAPPAASPVATKNVPLIKVPELANRPIQIAGTQLIGAGLAIFITEIARDSARGYVLAQNPAAGALVAPATPVHLIRGVKVPALGGMPLDSAAERIQLAELVFAPGAAGTRPAQRVLSQDPRPDTVVTPGTPLQLTFLDETPTNRPLWIVWVIAALVATIAGVGLLVNRLLHRKPPRLTEVPRVRPELHRDPGHAKIETDDELLGGTEVSLVARAGADAWSTTLSEPLISREEGDHD